MSRIDLSRVYVENYWASLLKDALGHRFHDTVRKESQIPAAEKAKWFSGYYFDCNRKFYQPRGRSSSVRGEVAVLQAPMAPRCGKNRRVVTVARFQQFIEKPRRVLR